MSPGEVMRHTISVFMKNAFFKYSTSSNTVAHHIPCTVPNHHYFYPAECSSIVKVLRSRCWITSAVSHMGVCFWGKYCFAWLYKQAWHVMFVGDLWYLNNDKIFWLFWSEAGNRIRHRHTQGMLNMHWKPRPWKFGKKISMPLLYSYL